MSEEETKRQFHKRSPAITKTYQPPYTSLRQAEAEKLTREVPKVSAPALPAMETEQVYVKVEGLSTAQLNDLSRQMQQAVNQAQLELNATEVAQQAEFEKDAEAALKRWKAEEINNLDEQIEQALAEQGITKADLRNNAKLRAQVTEWKRSNTADFKQKLAEAESAAIQESKARFEAAQRAQREQFKASVKKYESDVKSSITTVAVSSASTNEAFQKALAMKDAGLISLDQFNRYTANGVKVERIDAMWNQQTEKIQNQQKTVASLLAKGTVRVDGSQVTLIKPITALSDNELELLNKLGMNVPSLTKGPSEYVAEAAQKGAWIGPLPIGMGLMSSSFTTREGREQAGEMKAALLGDFVESFTSIWNLAASVAPLPKAELRGPTTATIKYYTDITPAQQAVLDIEGLGASFLGSYMAMLPVGLTAKGITLAASNIAAKTGVTAPKAIAKIASTLAAHPKIVQAIVWAPIAGFEAADVYTQIQAGTPVGDIIRREAKNITSMYAGMKGFQAGFALLPDKQIAQMQRLIKLKEVPTADGGTRWIPTVDKKKIPPALADIMKIEIDPITGDEVLVGIITADGIKQPFAMKVGNLLGDLTQGKAIGPDAVEGAILKYINKEQYGYLLQRGLDIKTMTPEQIGQLMLKELGLGTPYEAAITAQLKMLKSGSREIEILGVYSPDKAKAVGSVAKMFNELKSFGLSDDKASVLAGKILGTDSYSISAIAESLNLSESQTARLVEIWFEAGGASKSGIQVFNILKSEGLNPTQAQNAISALAKGSTGGEVLAKAMAKLENKTLSVVSSLMKSGEIESIVNFISSAKLNVIVEAVAPETASKLVSAMSAQALTGLAASISASAAAKVMPSLSTANLENLVVNMGSATLSSTMMELKPDQLNIILPNISDGVWSTIVPKLSPSALSSVVPNLTPSQLNRIMPEMSTDQLNEIMPKLSTEQMNYVLQALDIPPETMLRYLQTGQLGAVEGISPVLLKRLLDEKLKRNKKEDEKQKTRLFEVKLFYFSASETFKIKSNSFHGAARQALQRRRASGIPTEVVVTVQGTVNA